MPRHHYLLLLGLLATSSLVLGQEPPLSPLPAPPIPSTELGMEPELPASNYFHSYPDCRCEDWSCCRQWWCETWYARIELLALVRDHNPQARTLVETTGGTPRFNANDIDFELAPGISTLLGHRINGISALELSYFGANQWNEERVVGGAGNLRLPGGGATFAGLSGADSMEISLRSQMHNAEVNYLHDVQNVSLLAGFRYFNFQEQLNIHSTISNLDENDYHVALSNNLVGGQIGARLARYAYGLDFDLTGKAGIFGNQATQSQRITAVDGTVLNRNAAATEGVVSFLGDVNLSANCPLTRVWRLRGGLDLIYASSLALAANQLDFSDTPTSGKRVRQDADVFLYGFNVGLEAIW